MFNTVPLELIILNFGLKPKELWEKFLENGNLCIVLPSLMELNIYQEDLVAHYSFGMEDQLPKYKLTKAKFIQ